MSRPAISQLSSGAEISPPDALAPPTARAAAVAAAVCAPALARGATLVLTGSAARNEAPWRWRDARWRLGGDLDFLLLGPRPPSGAQTQAFAREARRRLAAAGLDAEICLRAGKADYLRRLRPSIFAFELRARGRVISGDSRLLQTIPSFDAAAVPVEDAWRLLNHRIIELLEWRADHAPDSGAAPARKLRLDLATALLVWLGHFAPGYAVRSARLSLLAAEGDGAWPTWPFPRARFAAAVRAATAAKLEGRADRESPDARAWPQLIADARALWRWRTEAFRAGPAQLGVRLRGWASVLRRTPFLHQLPLVIRASPRLWRQSARGFIYAAAGAALDALAAEDCPKGRQERTPKSLPQALVPALVPRLFLPWISGHPRDWREWSKLIAANYHRFLEDTQT